MPLAREADRLAVTVGPGNRHNTRGMRRSFGRIATLEPFHREADEHGPPRCGRGFSQWTPPALGRTMHVGQGWSVSSTRTARSARAGTSVRWLHATHRKHSRRDATTRPAIAGRSHVDAAPVTAASTPQARVLRGGGQIVGLTRSRGGGRVTRRRLGVPRSRALCRPRIGRTWKRPTGGRPGLWSVQPIVGRELVPEIESSP